MGTVQEDFSRMVGTWGERYFPQERAKLILKELSMLKEDHREWVVDDLIGNMRHAPTVADVRSKVSEFRIKRYERAKTKQSNEAKEFFSKQIIPIEDRMNILDTIKKRISGQIGDAEYKVLTDTLGDIAKENLDGKCRKCEGEGIIWAFHEQYETAYAFKCTCPSGSDFESYPVWKAQREYILERDFKNMMPRQEV